LSHQRAAVGIHPLALHDALPIFDADPTTNPYDGVLDADVFYGVNRLDIIPWGQTTLANLQRPSDLTNPNVPYQDCLPGGSFSYRSEEHTSELQSRENLVCRLLLE